MDEDYEEQTVNKSGIVFYGNSDEVFSFFSALPEMQSHRQLTHLGMGVGGVHQGTVARGERESESRERAREGGSGGMSKCFDTQQEVTQS